MLKVIRPFAVCAAFAIVFFASRAEAAWVRIVDKNPSEPIRLVEEHVTADIKDQIARVTLKPVFFNPNGRVLEGEFMMELDPGDVVENFALTINGVRQEAELLDATKARGIYEGIVSQMRDPGLLESVGKGLLKCRIFPIPPNGKFDVEVKLTQTLAKNGTMIQFQGITANPREASIALQEASFEATIEGSQALRSVFSPTHRLDIVRDGEKKAKVSFRETSYLPRNRLKLYFGLEGKDVGLSVLAHRQDAKSPGTFLATIAPKVELAASEVMPKDVVFVFDTSMSMAGEKMDQARLALEYCLNHLNPQDRFAVVDFATDVQTFRNSLTDASPANVKEGLDYVRKLKAKGGTAIEDALVRAFEYLPKRDDSRVAIVLFMTDGAPTIGEQDPDKLLASAGVKNVSKARLYVLGVGSDVQTRLLDLLAERNGGTRDYVGEGESLEGKTATLYDRISTPVLSDLKIAASSGVRIEQMYPRPIPDLFRGNQIFLYGQYEGEGSATITLEGSLGGKRRTFEYKVDFPSKESRNDYLPRLWAAQKIGFLLDEIKSKGESKEIVSEVVELAKANGIVTPYTSFLVVEDMPMRRPGGGFAPGMPMPTGAPEFAARALEDKAGRDLALDRESGHSGARAFKKAKGEARLREALGGGGVSEAPKPAEPGAKTPPATSAPAAPLAAMDKLADEAYSANSAEGKGETQGISASRVRNVGGKTFWNQGGVWIDADIKDRASEKDKIVKVKMFSEEHMKLVRENPDLAKFFSLGRVIVAFNGKVYEVEDALPAPTMEKK
ncbi:MAG: VIT and VWA domain-containing protein [Planctomycetota bacterium]